MKGITFHFNWAAYRAEVPIVIKIIYRTIGFVSVLLAILSTQLHLPEVVVANINIGLVIANKAIYEFCQFFHCPFPSDSDELDTEDKEKIEQVSQEIIPIVNEVETILPVVQKVEPVLVQNIKKVTDSLTNINGL